MQTVNFKAMMFFFFVLGLWNYFIFISFINGGAGEFKTWKLWEDLGLGVWVG